MAYVEKEDMIQSKPGLCAQGVVVWSDKEVDKMIVSKIQSSSIWGVVNGNSSVHKMKDKDEVCTELKAGD